jgi:hypothetical protein
MRVLIFVLLSAIVSLAKSGTITITFNPTSPQTNANPLQFNCVNNAWNIATLNTNVMTSVDGGLAYAPMTSTGLPTVNMTWYINGAPADGLTITNPQGVTGSTTIGNVWQFTLQDEQSQILAGISLGTCTNGQTQPSITLNLSTNTFVVGTGNLLLLIPAVSAVPTLVNSFNPANIFVLTTTAPTTAPTAAPTTAPTSAPTTSNTTTTPTTAPTNAPTSAAPTNAPTNAPTDAPTTLAPTTQPTQAAVVPVNPTNAPTKSTTAGAGGFILSTGAMVGIAAGAGVVALGAVAFFIVRRRKSKGLPTFGEESRMKRTTSVLLKNKEGDILGEADWKKKSLEESHMLASARKPSEVVISVRKNSGIGDAGSAPVASNESVKSP